MRTTKSLLLTGAMWMGLTKIAVNLVGLASTVILARLLMPEDFGLVAIASAVAIIFATVTELSLSQALIQHDDPGDDHYHTAFTLNLARAAVLTGLFALLAWPVAAAYGEPRLVEVILGLAVGTFLGGLINPRLAVFERKLEFRQVVTLNLAEKLTGFVAAVIVAVIFRSYWALVAGQVASQLARTIVSYLVISYRPRMTLRHGRELMSFSIWLTLGQAVQALNWRADPLILGAFLPTRTIGQFGMGGRVTNMAIADVLQPVSQVLFPALAQIRGEADRLAAAYLRAQSLLSLIGVPLGFGLAAVAEPLTAILLGPKWTGAVPVIQLLALAAVLPRLVSVNPVAMATGQTRALFMRDVRALAIRLPLLLGGLYAAPSIGVSVLVGALSGNLISAILNGLLNMRLVARIANVSVTNQLKSVWRPIVGAALMGLATWGTQGVWPVPPTLLGNIAGLALSVALGGLVYSAALGLLWLASGRPRGAETEATQIALAALARLRRRR